MDSSVTEEEYDSSQSKLLEEFMSIPNIDKAWYSSLILVPSISLVTQMFSQYSVIGDFVAFQCVAFTLSLK